MSHAKRTKRITTRNQLDTNSDYRKFGEFEQLEDKRCLAFLGFFDGITMSIDQTFDDGDIVIENTTGVWRATDNVTTFTYENAQNIEITLLDNTNNQLTFLLDNAITGETILNLGDGVRTVVFDGIANTMGGDLTINSGAGTQQVQTTGLVGAPLTVGGDVNVDMGTGDDTLLNGAVMTVNGDLTLTNVNEFQYSLNVGLPGPPITGGNVTIDTSAESLPTDIISAGGGTALGNFTYIGNDDVDRVEMALAVTGEVNIDLDISTPFFGDPQNVTLNGSSQGNVTIVAGDSFLGNVMDLVGGFTGNIVSYTGGNTVDIVNYSLGGPQADVFIALNGGDDIFNLNVPVNELEVDFGNDPGDAFNNNLGALEFEIDLLNLHFFDHLYTALNDTLTMNQLADTGDIIIDNDGPITGFDWRLFTGLGGMSSTVPAENLVLNMLSNTGNNVEIDLFNPVLASITMELGDGDRNVSFTGIANNPLRDINITADAGEQFVELAMFTPLGVATLNIDLGSGQDTVEDSANDLVVNEDLIFTGVDRFEHKGLLSVFRNAFIDNSGESEDAYFISTNTMFVGNFFTYLGGDGQDDVRLNGIVGGATITNDALIDLGDSNGLDQFVRLDSPVGTAFGADLTILSSNAGSNDVVTTNALTSYGGDIEIDLGHGPNQVELLGTFNGNSVAYTGGAGVDDVVYGLTGNPAALTVQLGAGADCFEILPGSSIGGPLIIDFGPGADKFINGFGTFNFDFQLLGLYGFDHVYTFATDSLVSTQVEDFGPIIVDNNGPGDAIQFINGGTTTLTPVTDLSITMLDGNNTLDIDFDNPHAGDLEINLGNGDRMLNFIGTNNSIGGNLNIFADTGDQTVEVAVNNGLTVGGTASFNLAQGNDIVDEDSNDITIGGNLTMSGVNSFENDGVMFVGGNVVVNTNFEALPGLFDDDHTMTIVGNFTYNGGLGNDDVTLNGAIGGTSIGGFASINVGGNILGGIQNIFFNLPASSVGGDLTVISTSDAQPDVFVSDAAANFGGNISIDLGGGMNTANIVGVLGGTEVTYDGGSGVDNVTFGTTGSPADVTVNLGTGDDTFTLLPGAAIQPTTLTVDFGGGNDTFNNLYGDFDFNANLLNLNAFDHVYNFIADSMTSTQVSASGPVIIDDGGTNDAIRFIDGGTTELTPVTDLTVNLLDGPGTDLEVDFDSALAGNLTLNLGNGARSLDFTGTDNSIGGDLTVTAGTGAQTVEVAVNSALTVGGHASFDLGSGFDVVDEDANDITILGNLLFTGVNDFENNGVMLVGGNVAVDNSGETESNRFDDDATISVFGNFNYLGGNGNDRVQLNGQLLGGTDINGNALIDLGNNVLGGNQEVLLNTADSSIGGTLTIISTSTLNLDVVSMAPGAFFGDDISIDLGGGTNTANIEGIFGGSDISYDGGPGVDNVIFGTTGSPADVVINLGAGADTFTLLPGASIDPTTLTVDFGGGSDTFNNLYGDFDFNANLLNLNGFDHIYNDAGSSLEITQVGASGPITVDNNGLNDAIRVNGASTVLTPVDNLAINMLNNSGTTLNVVLDNAHSGDLWIDLGDGARSLNFDGVNNTVGGNLSIFGGTGTQIGLLAVNNDLTVGGSALIDLGLGGDAIDESGNNITVGGQMELIDVNTFDNDGNLMVGGNLTVDNSGETEPSAFTNDGLMTVNGNFLYNGSNAADDVLLNAGSTFNGDLNVNAFAGTNNIILRGTFSGGALKYNGGSGIDNVAYGLTGTPINPNIKLSTGNDNFILDAGSAIDTMLRVDFGRGFDNFTNNFGAFTFDANLLNWFGFDRFYDLATDSLNMQQDLDLGDVTLDNNGAGNAIRLIGPGVSEMIPATDVRLIFLNNSSSNLTVDNDSAFVGDTVIQLRSGNRDVHFTGSSNTFNGLLRIEASDGMQDVHLAVNADLDVAGNLVVNGRDGSDSIDDGANNINVGNDMLLRGINQFTNDNTLNVANNFNVIGVLESTDTRIANNGIFNVGGNITYLGGTGVDEFLFNGGVANITGYTYIHLGEGNDLFDAQRVRLIGNYSTSELFVVARNNAAGNTLVTDASTNVAGDLTLNFENDTLNTIILLGNVGGANASYRGGTAIDNVTFGVVAAGSPFVFLMGADDDTFVLEASTFVQSLLVDFGPGNDTLVDNLGQPYPFPAFFANL